MKSVPKANFPLIRKSTYENIRSTITIPKIKIVGVAKLCIEKNLLIRKFLVIESSKAEFVSPSGAFQRHLGILPSTNSFFSGIFQIKYPPQPYSVKICPGG